MSINIGKLHRKSTLRRLDGSIINYTDEADGGDIIRGGRVVNEEKYNEMTMKEADRKEAAKAPLNQVDSPNAHLRTKTAKEVNEAELKNETPTATQIVVEDSPSIEIPLEDNRVDNLEKKVEGLEGKLDAILDAINKK